MNSNRLPSPQGNEALKAFPAHSTPASTSPSSACGTDCCAPFTITQPTPARKKVQGHSHAHGEGHGHGHAHDHDHDHGHDESDPHAGHDHSVLPGWPRITAALIAAVLAEAAHWVSGSQGGVPALQYGGMAVAVLAIALSGLGVYKAGIRDVLRLKLGIHALMAIAVTGAFAIGQWPEAAMVMALYAAAERIEDQAMDRARNAIRSLLQMAPETADVLQPDGSVQRVAAADVALDATVRVAPGARVPLDGVVLRGQSSVNQAPITGESLPVEKAEGDQVFAGTINETGSFEYKVTAGASDSTLARIIHAVESAQGSRAPTQRFVDQFARVYTPAVFAVSVLVAVVPPLAFGGAWFDWVYKALVLLVIACPCALVISTPVTIVSGLAAAARRGILIKGGVYLEGGRKLKALALDKTGTLTHGKPEQTDFVPLIGEAQEVAAWAASLAARSDHPVSQAIARKANRDGIALHEVDDFAALPGRGVRGRVAGRMLHMGNHRLAQELGLSEATLQARLETLERQGKTAILLMDDATVLGIFAVADTVKETSREAVADLQALGVRTLMLTGDNQHTAAAIAAQVGISEARGDQLPEDKLKTIESLVGGEGQVGMVGDGINDSPALARADIGFAMGAAGSEVAIHSATIALMNNDLRRLPFLVRLSRQTRSVINQNFLFGIVFVIGGLIMAAMKIINPVLAAVLHVLGSLLVVFNSFRLVRQGEDLEPFEIPSEERESKPAGELKPKSA